MVVNTVVSLHVAQQPAWFNSLHGDIRTFFETRLNRLRNEIDQLNEDNLAQLAPIVLVTGRSIVQLRKKWGRGVWRKVHHADETTNFLRALVWLRHREGAQWHEVIRLPAQHLRSVRNAANWNAARFAAHAAEAGRFSQTLMLYLDVVKMGGQPRRSWSVSRLKKEHVSRVTSAAIAEADPAPWAAPFMVQVDGFTFSRLISDRDFVAEGISQRHCVATFRDRARSGACIAFACEGRVRATLRFDAEGDWELTGRANVAVPSACLSAAKAAYQAFWNQQKLSATPATFG